MKPQQEVFILEGAEKETETPRRKRKNKAKEVAQKLRNSGKEYVSVKTGNLAAAKKIHGRCNADKCRGMGKQCGEIPDEERKKIFDQDHGLGNLTR
ncbi:unnamed protein product [Acanthoscelides obtectus]|uniref:Uncharacterized protein n=1 Tax=Acanthoscelides obtectus TaxID=200917 RepID=A0A9P0NUI4_ACAOB|nr:unnamed protein product [Acanthoscelides obtectus]CAK1678805.1 hypothetical protein AOBTE_LOCUS32025 [Acanthoscelides obtectus]